MAASRPVDTAMGVSDVIQTKDYFPHCILIIPVVQWGPIKDNRTSLPGQFKSCTHWRWFWSMQSEMKSGAWTSSLTALIPAAIMCAVIVIMKMPASIHSLSVYSLCCMEILAELPLQCHLMSHGSCIGMLHKTKPKRIRHYAEHLRSPLTNVTAQTDKDLNVDVLCGGVFFFLFLSGPGSYRGYSITSIAHVFINNCGIKRTILGHKVNDKSAIWLSARQCFSFKVRRREENLPECLLSFTPRRLPQSPQLWQLLQRATCVLNMWLSERGAQGRAEAPMPVICCSVPTYSFYRVCLLRSSDAE